MRKYLISMALCLFFVSSLFSYENTLYVFNWTEYIDPDIVKEFEEKYDCEVIEDNFDSNESMLTKVINAGKSYDLVCPSGDHVTILREKDQLEKLDMSLLPNWKHLDENILTKLSKFDMADGYAMPYFWGVTGILYNPEFLDEADKENIGWNIYKNEKYKDKAMMLNDAREVVGAALIVSGYSVNDFSPEAIEKAKDVLVKWDDNISQYDSDAYKNDVPQNEVWIAQAYNGDALQVIRDYPNLKFSLPKEGGTYWIDSFVMLKNAENKDMAYKFLNYLMDPEIAARNAEWVEYPTPNKSAYDNFVSEESKNNENIYVSQSYLDKCYPINFLGEDVIGISNLFERICLNVESSKDKKSTNMLPIWIAIFVAVFIPIIAKKKRK